jgi:hypothetical protein
MQIASGASHPFVEQSRLAQKGCEPCKKPRTETVHNFPSAQRTVKIFEEQLLKRPRTAADPSDAAAVTTRGGGTSGGSSEARNPEAMIPTGGHSSQGAELDRKLTAGQGLLDHFLALELCSGSARLTKHWCDKGINAVGIDWKRNASRPEGPSILLDLTNVNDQAVLRRAVEQGLIWVVHAAPPCGTATRARDRPIPQWLKDQGAPEPKPLRSQQEPQGLASLEGTDLLRVQAANLIYEIVAEVCLIMDARGRYWCIENPANSWMWQTKWLKKLAESTKKKETFFPHCLYGGTRPKWTKFLHNIPAFEALAGVCPGDHEHEPWGLHLKGGSWKFDTAGEAVYPKELCQKMSQLTLDQLLKDGVQLQKPPVLPPKPVDKLPKRPNLVKASAGRQARGQQGPTLLPEHRNMQKFYLEEEDFNKVEEGQVLAADLRLGSFVLPKTAKVVRKASSKEGEKAEPSFAIVVAMPWTEEEFLEEALKLEHPVDTLQGLPPEIYRAIFHCLTRDVKSFRKKTLDHWKTRSMQLQPKEDELHEQLPPEFKVVLQGKRILLLQEMMKAAGHQDEMLIHRITTGFQITGELDHTPEFEDLEEARVREASLDVTALMKTSRWSRHVLMASLRSSGNNILDRAVYDDTVAEAKKGWAEGPMSQHELDKRFGPLWVASRRFGIEQGVDAEGKPKIRSIDDLTEFHVNKSVTVRQKIDLGGVDVILATAKCMATAVDDDRNVCVPDGSGGWMQGRLNESWTISQARTLLGRTVDLKAAYKAFLRRAADGAFSIIGVYNPYLDTKELFVAFSLMFGATGSVYGFNRAALAARKILIKLFSLPLTSFFDDYVQVEFEVLADSADATIKEVFGLLGWRLAEEKNKDFSAAFKALGVLFDFAKAEENVLTVRNTEARVKSVSDEADALLLKGSVTRAEAASLRGKLAFSEAQHWSRCGTMVTSALSEAAEIAGGSSRASRLGEDLKLNLHFIRWLMNNAQPRVLQPRALEGCTCVFVDGAAEGEGRQDVACAGVIFSPRLSKPQFFSHHMSKELVMHWASKGSKQVIGQAELFPVLLSKQAWMNELLHARVLWFIDNEAAREGLVKSFSPAWASKQILLQIAVMDAKLPAMNWYARVPSVANVSDGPSRDDFDLMRKLMARQVQVVEVGVGELCGSAFGKDEKEF